MDMFGCVGTSLEVVQRHMALLLGKQLPVNPQTWELPAPLDITLPAVQEYIQNGIIDSHGYITVQCQTQTAGFIKQQEFIDSITVEKDKLQTILSF